MFPLTPPAPGYPARGGAWWFGAPRSNGARTHGGNDHPCPSSIPILAGADGLVISSGWLDELCGNGIRLALDPGRETILGYCHALPAGLAPLRSVVRAGDVIARAGSTGNSAGPHVHWSITAAGGHRIDPWPLVTHPEITGPRALWMQRRLTDHGLNPGPLDGIAGRRTLAALGAFQAGHEAKTIRGVRRTFALDPPTVTELSRRPARRRLDRDAADAYHAAAFPDIG